jgi:polyphosphate glucokinase
MQILGIDIGGTGIKGAPVETKNGQLLLERKRLLTPEGAKPKDVASTVAELAAAFDWKGPVGCGFPAVVRSGTVFTAANIHKSWIGTPVEALFGEALARSVRVINDADAAGLAEMHFGAGVGEKGVVLIVTIGTGLGTAIFSNGQLFPNTELGHIELECLDAELQASDAARKRDEISWKKWSKRFNKYLLRVEELIWPDLIILGGGAIKKFEVFAPSLTVRARVVPAQFMNEAGIVGAALAAENAG